MPATKGGVSAHIHIPRRLFEGPHLPDETLAQRKLDSLRSLLKGSILLCSLQMPNGCRHPLCHAWSHCQIRVAYGPAHIGADAVHGKLQGFCTPGRPIGRNSDVVEQL